MSKIFVKKSGEDKFSYFAVHEETPPDDGVYIEATREVLDGLTNRTLCWENGKIVPNTEKVEETEVVFDEQFELAVLKDKLRSSNDKAVEFAAGEITAEEFEPIKQQRKAWRERINELEKLLN